MYPMAISITSADYPYPVGPPCDCDARNINCDSRGLTEVPHFNITNGTNWWVDLSNNSISYIQSQAFANLKGMNYLRLKDNKIESIADNALEGSENTLHSIFMSNNKIRTLPPVIAKMRVLSSLGVDGNPLQSYDPNVLKAIGPTLHYFTFGSPEMTLWPSAVQYLRNLTSLTIRNSPVPTLPSYAFLGLQKVEIFDIENCMLTSIPTSLYMMSSLQILSLDSDPYMPLSGIPGEAFNGMSSLSSITIRNQSYETLPNIFHDAISMNSIDVSMTPITYIPASLIPDDTPMTDLSLNDTKLDRIPEAVSKMKRLRQLIIRYSNISSLSYLDFRGLTSLTYLGIFYSPLSEITNNAFADMDSLRWLNLDNTNLNTIPKALLHLKNPQNLSVVSLDGNNIICNCESLSWFKEFQGTPGLQVIGTCINIRMDLRTYIAQEIPKCP